MKNLELWDNDYAWLETLIKNSYAKMLKNPSAYDMEHALHVERIAKAFDGSVAPEPEPEKKKTRDPVIKADLCKTHPSYGASRPPRTECAGCWQAYRSMQPLKYDLARRKFLSKKRREKSSE